MTAPSYPNFAGKHAEEAIFTPADFVAYLRRVGRLERYRPPEGQVAASGFFAQARNT
ncbi:MAG TPA: hypothetical protein VG253_25150 [Streptosporangiaceae bacterium]|nr:hypothetical protein [Streptosporangiaceae bacterium]